VNWEGSARISQDTWGCDSSRAGEKHGPTHFQRQMGMPEKKEEGKGRKSWEKRDTLKGFPDQQLGNCLISHLFRFSCSSCGWCFLSLPFTVAKTLLANV